MKIVTRTIYLMTKKDKELILQQLKARKIRRNDLCQELGISRTAFYEILEGKYPVNEKILNYLAKNEIIVPFTF